MRRAPTRIDRDAPWHRAPPASRSLSVALLIVSIVLARLFPALAMLPKEMTLSFGAPINDAVRWISKTLFPYIKPDPRHASPSGCLLPMRDFYLWLPWPAVIGTLAVIGWHLGGWRLALLPVWLFGFLLIDRLLDAR